MRRILDHIAAFVSACFDHADFDDPRDSSDLMPSPADCLQNPDELFAWFREFIEALVNRRSDLDAASQESQARLSQQLQESQARFSRVLELVNRLAAAIFDS